MTQWQYKVTVSDLPRTELEKAETTFNCDHQGQCVVHDSVAEGGVSRMENLFNQEGKGSWELVQFEYHQNQLLCVWKRPEQ